MEVWKDYPCLGCGKIRRFRSSYEGKTKISKGKTYKIIPDKCKPCSHKDLAAIERAKYPITIIKSCPECGKERNVKWEFRFAGELCEACCGKRGRARMKLKHGGLTAKHKELYGRWIGMFRRCRECKTYIQKGIAVCEEWQQFSTFVSWSLKNGHVPKTHQHLDRINSNKGYSPANCRWISEHENLSRPTAITITDIEFIADKTRQGWTPPIIYDALYATQ